MILHVKVSFKKHREKSEVEFKFTSMYAGTFLSLPNSGTCQSLGGLPRFSVTKNCNLGQPKEEAEIFVIKAT